MSRKNPWDVLNSHSHKHANKVWDEPDQPDEEAEFMEGFLLVGIAFTQRPGGPNGVEEHQCNGQGSGHPMNGQLGGAHPSAASSGNDRHQGCPAGVAHQAHPKNDHMPF